MDERLLGALGEAGLGALTTLKRDGRAQLSMVSYQYRPDVRQVVVSVTDDRAKVKNLRRDPRVSMLVQTPDGGYVVVVGEAELGPVARDPHDAEVDALVEHFRVANGEHDDWDAFRAAMVRDQRLLLRFTATHAYGWTAG